MIERKGAREILVRSLASDLVNAGRRYSPGSTGRNIVAYSTLPHRVVWRDNSPAVEVIAGLDPEFRVLDEVDGIEQGHEQSLPLRVESKAYWGTLRLAH